MAVVMAGVSRGICTEDKKPASANRAGYLLTAFSLVGFDTNSFEFSRGNALFPLGWPGDVCAGAA